MSELLKKYLDGGNKVLSKETDKDNSFLKTIQHDDKKNPFQRLINDLEKTTHKPSDGTLNQFYKIYQNRLQHFRPKIKEQGMKSFFPKSTYYNKILDIQPTVLSQSIKKDQDISLIDTKAFCWSVGTIYTEMKYKPDILNQVAKDLYGLPERPNNYVYDENKEETEEENREILFEDESGRIVLRFDHKNIKKEILVTGVVVGILGYVDLNNDLQVIDYCFPPKLAPPSIPSNNTTESKALIVSGLELSQDTDIEKLTTLQFYLSGAIVNDCNTNLIILGNSLLSYNNLTMFNEFLSTVIRSKTITLIPSLNDPSDRLVPQRPLNVKLLDRLLQLNTQELLSLQPNPTYWDSFNVYLEAGDSVNDIVKYGDYDNEDDRTSIIKNLIKWQNIAPTAPDTLNTQPFDINEIDDPFMLKEKYPKAVIIGNQPTFINTSHEGVHLIGVPQFSKTSQLLELNLNNFDYRLIQL
ncbi:hypothetical protein QEN19_002776 [Hanseniaspora menglaensis]